MAEIKPKSNRGGARKGAGRKPGTKERIAKAGAKERAVAVHQAVLARIEPESAKLDPVEAIMETVEWAIERFRACALIEDWKGAQEWAECMNDWSAKAAPYIRPRLAAVEAKVNVNITVYERIERANQRLAIAA